MLSIFENLVYAIAPAEQVANWIAVDILRYINIDERPKILDSIKIWRKDVYDIIVTVYVHHIQEVLT